MVLDKKLQVGEQNYLEGAGGQSEIALKKFHLTEILQQNIPEKCKVISRANRIEIPVIRRFLGNVIFIRFLCDLFYRLRSVGILIAPPPTDCSTN